MKINLLNNLSFQKTLVAKAGIITNKKSEECNIYSLNPEEDYEYFSDLSNDENWDDNQWAYIMDCAIRKMDYFQERNFYVLENNNEECLGYVQTYEKTDQPKDNSLSPLQYDYINYLEVAPQLQNNDIGSQKNNKYIGETLFAFLCKLSQATNKKCIKLNSTDDSITFYDKCNCTYVPRLDNNYMIISEDNYEKTIKQNEQHTGRKIELIG